MDIIYLSVYIVYICIYILDQTELRVRVNFGSVNVHIQVEQLLCSALNWLFFLIFKKQKHERINLINRARLTIRVKV